MGKRRFYLGRLARVLWLRAGLFALIAVGAALLAQALSPLAPAGLVGVLRDEAVEDLLGVLASSMLAVATFSLATLVASAAAVTTNASPRAAALMLEDRSAQGALSAFIAAFVFSIVGLIATGLNVYSREALFILFIETLLIIGYVVVRLLGWVDQLSRIGRVGEAVGRVEAATRHALHQRRSFLGGAPAREVPSDAVEVRGASVGYVQHVDVGRLQALADRHGLTVHLTVLPGAFAPPSREVLRVQGAADDALMRKLQGAVVIGATRTYDQDPRFGLVVLGEIASRALSPAINDPGTAIGVVGALVRLLGEWADHHDVEPPRPRYPRVFVPPLSAADLFEDAFRPMARDAARTIEVGVVLQKALGDLATASAPGFRRAARAQSSRALALALPELPLPADRAELRRLAARVGRSSDRDQVGRDRLA